MKKSTLRALSVLLFSTPAFADATVQIDPLVLLQTEDGKEASYWAIFKAQPDLSPAEDLWNWRERGRFVYDELRSTAEADQRPCHELLTRMGVKHQGFWITNAIYITSGRNDLMTLAEGPGVMAIQADATYNILPLPGTDEPQVGSVGWNIAQIRADRVWSSFGDTGQGIVVGTIDTGVDYLHSALVQHYRGNLGSGAFNHNYNWWDPSHVCGPAGSAPCDNSSHGTHTMGTIVGGDGPGPFTEDIGVAPGARWIAAKGCEGFGCSTFALVSSGQWMLAPTDMQGANANPDLRPHIVSNSWGGGSGSTFYRDVVRAWRAAGIFPVFANGNAGPNCSTAISPGDYPESFAVGATDSTDTVATFSSRGPSVLGPIKPEVSAPGLNVRSSVPGNGYQSLSGTSMATPHVAGAVALLWSAEPDLIGDFPRTTALLKNTALNRVTTACGGDSDGDPNNTYGDGRLDAFALVSAAARPFQRGGGCMSDNNVSAAFTISDPIGLLSYLFRGGTRPACLNACDENDDNRVDLSDATSMLQYLFIGGSPPPPPFPGCGFDPTPSALECQTPSCTS